MVIMRSNTNNGIRGRTSFVLIGCERSGQYRAKKKDSEHNINSYTTIKQIYNARNAYRSSIRGSNNEMQQLMKLLGRDQYIH
ncbi:hypothetical protein GmHk_19G054250 [Glycine max]|nr:hypothetical protein GmHk_19G054250 [Glycine max]